MVSRFSDAFRGANRRMKHSPPQKTPVLRKDVTAAQRHHAARVVRVAKRSNGAVEHVASRLASSDTRHRGGRATHTAPTAQDVADLLRETGEKILSARSVRRALGSRKSIVRKARDAARARSRRRAVRQRVAKAEEEGVWV